MGATLSVVEDEFSTPSGPLEFHLSSGDSLRVTLTPALVFPITGDIILAQRCWLQSKGAFLGVRVSEPVPPRLCS